MEAQRIGRDVYSKYGNRATARTMFKEFNGEELSEQRVFERNNPQAIVESLAQAEWSRLAAEIMPPEIVEALKPIANTLAEKFGGFIDATSERVHAEELRQNFGEAQSPEAFPILNALTIMLEEGFQAEIQAAQETTTVMDSVRQQIREIVLRWHALQVAEQEAHLQKLDDIEENVTAQGATTQFATAEANSMTQALHGHRETLQKNLDETQKKLLTFGGDFFNHSFRIAEQMVYEAPHSVVISQLNPERAIPVTTADLPLAV